MTSDGTHAIVSLRETVSFLALGIDDLRFDPAQLEDLSSSYFSSLAAIAINRWVAATRHPSYPLLKVISIQLKYWATMLRKIEAEPIFYRSTFEPLPLCDYVAMGMPLTTAS
jgi:hypothetical protein